MRIYEKEITLLDWEIDAAVKDYVQKKLEGSNFHNIEIKKDAVTYEITKSYRGCFVGPEGYEVLRVRIPIKIDTKEEPTLRKIY